MNPPRSERPRLLDLFCGAGGAATGYHRAGFDIVGVDIKAQPRYPFDFVLGDALTVDLDGFDAIHASPPCQAHSSIGKQARTRRVYDHPDLIAATRARLIDAGVPYVIENVQGAPLRDHIRLCGSSFGLDVRRHRLFECSFPIMALPCAHHWQLPRFPLSDKRRTLRTVVPVHSTGQQLATVVAVYGKGGNYADELELRKRAMGIDWMSTYELTQAIPPAYTQYVGEYLLTEVRRRLGAVA